MACYLKIHFNPCKTNSKKWFFCWILTNINLLLHMFIQQKIILFEKFWLVKLKPHFIVWFPKFKAELCSPNALNEDYEISQSPENISDCEEESKFCENMRLKIESMKNIIQFKESQLISHKRESFSQIFKNHKQIQKIHPFRNLIFNPICKKELLERHLKKVHTSLVYAVHHLRKPNHSSLHSQFVHLAEQKGNNNNFFVFDFHLPLLEM